VITDTQLQKVMYIGFTLIFCISTYLCVFSEGEPGGNSLEIPFVQQEYCSKKKCKQLIFSSSSVKALSCVLSELLLLIGLHQKGYGYEIEGNVHDVRGCGQLSYTATDASTAILTLPVIT
jgi:hypothetical protein